MANFATNKKAYFDYNVEETFEAGIALFGSEVKAIRSGNINLKGNFVRVKNGEIAVEKMHIGPYKYTAENHEPLRSRKLLLNKKEILRIAQALDQKGVTGIVLEVYPSHGLIKAKIGLCKHKKKYDKRESLKKKATQRDIERALQSR